MPQSPRNANLGKPAAALEIGPSALSPELYRRAFEESNEAIAIIDGQSRYVIQNRAHYELLGYSDEQMTGQTPALHMGEKAFAAASVELQETGRYTKEVSVVRADGERIRIELSAFRVSLGSDQAPYFVGIKRDLRGRQKTEKERAQHSIAKTLQLLPDYGIVVIDENRVILLANHGAQRIFGPVRPSPDANLIPQALGIYLPDQVTYFPVEQLPFVRSLLGETVSSLEIFVKNEHVAQGVCLEASARPIRDHRDHVIGAVLVFHDVTKVLESERRRSELESELRQVQKMESIGQLAAGIAHDFNNLLTPILGYTEAVLEGMPVGSRDRQSLERTVYAAERARELVQQLLAFGRKQMLRLCPQDLNQKIREIHGVLRRVIAENIEIALDLAVDVPTIRADSTQIDQILLNLAANAADAMPEGGLLRIETATVELSESERKSAGLANSGPAVRLTVRDSGCGIGADVLERVFEPFFSTKERGHGTGLGLSTVYGIVKQHGGGVHIDSSRGQGTTVTVLFPAVEEAPEPSPKPSEDLLVRGTETVLVVEDDEAVRSLVCDLLQQHGYGVLSAGQSAEAIDLSRECKQPIHLLLTDVVMPGGDGKALYDQISASRAETRVLYMSGYASETLARHGRVDSRMQMLQKPFRASRLLTLVRGVLDEPTRWTES